MTTIRAFKSRADAETPIYQVLRHAFRAAQHSSTADRNWTLHSCFTDERHVMTQYVHTDGSMIRADSTGEREGGVFPDHEFTFYPKPEGDREP